MLNYTGKFTFTKQITRLVKWKVHEKFIFKIFSVFFKPASRQAVNTIHPLTFLCIKKIHLFERGYKTLEDWFCLIDVACRAIDQKNFKKLSAQAVGVPVGQRLGGWLVTTLVASINDIIFFFFFSFPHPPSSTFLGHFGYCRRWACVPGVASLGWH